MRHLLYLSCAGLAAYEVAALRSKEDGDTISEKVWALSKRPLIPFAFGMLAGHFFWQRQD